MRNGNSWLWSNRGGEKMSMQQFTLIFNLLLFHYCNCIFLPVECCTLYPFHIHLIWEQSCDISDSTVAVVWCLLWLWRSFPKSEKLTPMMSEQCRHGYFWLALWLQIYNSKPLLFFFYCQSASLKCVLAVVASCFFLIRNKEYISNALVHPFHLHLLSVTETMTGRADKVLILLLKKSSRQALNAVL